MVILKPTTVVVGLLSFALLSPLAAALPQQEVGNISCELVVDYVATNPPYYTLFQSFLEGYLAGGRSSSALARDNREVTTLMSAVIDYCKGHADTDFGSAIAATVKK